MKKQRGWNKFSASHKAKARRAPGSMTRAEQAWARCLEARLRAGELLFWSFEPVKLRLAKACFYQPDFLLVFADLTIGFDEVKGGAGWQLDEGSRIKWKVAGELYPFLRFRGAVQQKGGGWEVEEYTPHGAWPTLDQNTKQEEAR